MSDEIEAADAFAERKWQMATRQDCPHCGAKAVILYGSQWTCKCGRINPVEDEAE